MDSLKEFLKITQSRVEKKRVLLYILYAYLFSITIRLLLYYQISDNSSYFYNGTIIPIWTHDSGLYGYYAQQLLEGVSYPFISEYMPGYLLYWLVHITGLGLDNVLFFAPVFLSSLIVVPIILIAQQYRVIKIGLYATLFGSTMTSYYYRTHLGYYDTDVLNAIFPLLAIYFLIKLVESKKIIYALFSSIVLIAFSFWYHSSESIIFSIILILVIYMIIFERKEIYLYQSIIILATVPFPIVFQYKIALIIALAILFWGTSRYKVIDYKYYLLVFIIGIVAIFFLINVSKMYNRMENYVNKSDHIELASKQGTAKFTGDLVTVAEAKSIDFSTLAYRVSGWGVFFIIALLGYLSLLISYKSMFLTIPIFFLTFISLIAGLRFTMYGVPLFAFTLVYGIELLFRNILVVWGEYSQKVSTVASKIFIFFVVLYAILSISKYNSVLSPTLFSSTEDIKALKTFKKISKRGDFVLAWWDTGWPLWYYTNRNTLIDNGKHGEDNYIVSKILLSNNENFVRNASLFFINKYKKNSQSDIMRPFLRSYPIEYLDKLEDENMTLPKIRKDTYILLHRNMLSNYYSIEMYSNIDIKTGKEHTSNLLDIANLKEEYSISKKSINTSKFTIDTQSGAITAKGFNGSVINRLSILKNGKLLLNKSYPSSSNTYILINNQRVFVLNKKSYNSFLIQALIFNNYDKNLFKEIAKSSNILLLKVL